MSDGSGSDGLGRLRHDLRTPLTIVIGFAEIMAAEHALTDEQRRDLSRRVLRAAFEMRALIDAMAE
jgi:signal transduction histidine kinase